MGLIVSPNQLDIQIVFQSFLLGLNLASSAPQVGPIEVVQGQDNRVAEPVGPDFVVFTPIRRARFSTNLDDFQDCAFTGSIAGSVMTVTAVQFGAIIVGAPVYGPTVAAGTQVASFGTGTGGVGTYNVTLPQSVASGPLAAGTYSAEQDAEMVFQVDVHGPNSADNAHVISTMMRDPYAVAAFTGVLDQNNNPITGVTPLYADDPRQVPFINAESQYEYRWVLEACVQANQVVSGVPQQFAAAAKVVPVSVEATYH